MITIKHIEVDGSAYIAARKIISSFGKVRKIGEGSYGTVYGVVGSDVVYKIGNIEENEPYLAYIKLLSRKRKHNPYTPIIHDIKFIRNKNGRNEGYFIIAMEKLKEMTDEMNDIFPLFSYVLYHNRDISVFKENTIDVTKELKDVITTLKKAYKSCVGWVSWDLHNGNFMRRDNQIVVIDPLS